MTTSTSTTMRYGNKWTISEIISLQREYELLEWTVSQIAEKHKRSEKSILFKLQNEGFISSWEEARGFDVEKYKAETNGTTVETETKINTSETKNKETEDLSQVSDDFAVIEELYIDERFEDITNRILSLEKNIKEINSMVKQMFEVMVSNKRPQRKPLRKY